MRPTKARKPYHAILENGDVVRVGNGDYTLQDGQIALEFNTRKERALNVSVVAWERKEGLKRLQKVVESEKSDAAYAGKYENAQRLLTHVVSGTLPDGTYTAEDYPYIEIEIKETGNDALTIAQSVVSAVNRSQHDDMGTLAKEAKRVQLREYVKTQLEALDG